MLRVLSCIEILVGHVIRLKVLMAAEFESSELLYTFVKTNGYVGIESLLALWYARNVQLPSFI